MRNILSYLNTDNYAKSAELYDKAAGMGMEPAQKRAEEVRAKMKN